MILPAGARKILRNPATLPPGKDECYNGTFQSRPAPSPIHQEARPAAGVLNALGFEIVNTRDRNPSSSSWPPFLAAFAAVHYYCPGVYIANLFTAAAYMRVNSAEIHRARQPDEIRDRA